MEYPRRSIPSVSGLIAFEATARHLSFSRAAEDIALTQGAVSKRVRQLEAVLGCQLLVRNTNQVCLTEVGEAYLVHTRELLRHLNSSTEAIRDSARGRDAIRIAAPTAFASRWLVPRLSGFSRVFPNSSINIVSFCSTDDPRLAEVDCVIFDGPLPWRDGQAVVIASSQNIVVASPGYMREAGQLTPRHIAGKQLLTCNHSAELWQQWFAAAGYNESIVEGARFDDLSVLIEATLAGQGIALLPEFLVSQDIRRCRLQMLFPENRGTDVQYRLAVPLRHKNRSAIQNFTDWISNENPKDPVQARRPDADADSSHRARPGSPHDNRVDVRLG